MRQQGRFLALVTCSLLVGCNNSGKDKEVAVGTSAKQPLNSQKEEKLLPLATNSPAPTIALEEWTSDPALQAQLGEEKSIFTFAYHIPFEYRFPGSGGNVRFYFITWKGETRTDNSVAEFTVVSGRLDAEMKSMPLEQAARKQLTIDQQRFNNAVPGKVSLGTINGIPFYKTTFTMVDTKTSMPGRATVYHGHLGNHFIHFVYHDVEPHLAQTEKLLEAAVLSVRPKP